MIGTGIVANAAATLGTPFADGLKVFGLVYGAAVGGFGPPDVLPGSLPPAAGGTVAVRTARGSPTGQIFLPA